MWTDPHLYFRKLVTHSGYQPSLPSVSVSIYHLMLLTNSKQAFIFPRNWKRVLINFFHSHFQTIKKRSLWRVCHRWGSLVVLKHDFTRTKRQWVFSVRKNSFGHKYGFFWPGDLLKSVSASVQFFHTVSYDFVSLSFILSSSTFWSSACQSIEEEMQRQLSCHNTDSYKGAAFSCWHGALTYSRQDY